LNFSLPRLTLLASLHRRTVNSTGAKDLQTSPTPNASVSVNYQCTGTFFLTVGSTGASGTSPPDHHAFSSLHRRLPSYSVGSIGATDLIIVPIPQCTGQFIFMGVDLTGRPFPAVTYPIHRCSHLDTSNIK
jgi:hypothetical protein